MITGQPKVEARQFFQTNAIPGTSRSDFDKSDVQTLVDELKSGYQQLCQMDNSEIDGNKDVGKLDIQTSQMKGRAEFSGSPEQFAYSLEQPSSLGDSYTEVQFSPEKVMGYRHNDRLSYPNDHPVITASVEGYVLDLQHPELSYILTK